MSTKSKSKGEWKSKTLKEWKQSESVVWRAQMSRAPDGKEFVGVRQYIITAKSGEIAGRSGVTFALDEKSNVGLSKVIALLKTCMAHVGDIDDLDQSEGVDEMDEMAEDDEDAPAPKSLPKIPAPKSMPRAAKAKAASSTFATQFQLKKNTGKFLLSVSAESVKVTSDSNKAQLFSRKQAEKILSERLSDQWAIVTA